MEGGSVNNNKVVVARSNWEPNNMVDSKNQIYAQNGC